MVESPFPPGERKTPPRIRIRCASVTSEAIQVHGGYGFTDEYLVSRLFRGARYGTLGGGATETLKDLIGKRLVNEGDSPDGILALALG